MNKRIAVLAAVALAAALGSLGTWQTPAVEAHGFVDQAWEGPPEPRPGRNASAQTISLQAPLGMEFTPSQPTLVGIDVSIIGVNEGGDATIEVRIREASISGTILASASREIAESIGGSTGDVSFFHFDLTTPISVAPAQTYVIEVASSTSSHAWNGAEWPGHGGEYPGGEPIVLGTVSGTDFFFRTYSEEAPPGSPSPTASPTPMASQTPAPSHTAIPSSTSTPPPAATPTGSVPPTVVVLPIELPNTGSGGHRSVRAELYRTFLAVTAASLVALGGAAWYARKRLVS